MYGCFRPIAFLIFCSLFLHIQPAAIDDCKNVLKEISAFAETGFDVIKEMKLLEKQLPQLLRLVGPAGIVLSELEDSEELKAIAELQKTVLTKFAEMKTRIDDNYHSAQYEDEMRDYKHDIALKLTGLEDRFRLLKSRDVAALDAFNLICITTHNPIDILRALEMSIQPCPVATEHHGAIYSSLSAMFRRFEAQNLFLAGHHRADDVDSDEGTATAAAFPPDYYEMKMLTLDHMMARFSLSEVEAKIKQIEKEFFDKLHDTSTANYKHLFNRLYPYALALHPTRHHGAEFRAEENAESTRTMFSCFLTKVAFRFHQRRAPIANVMQIIKTHLLKITVMGQLCVAVASSRRTNTAIATTYNDDQIALQKEITENILRTLSNWYKAKLVHSWPDIIKTEAIAAIGDEEIKNEKFVEVARKIVAVADEIGYPGIGYNAIVGESEPIWERHCKATSCTEVFSHTNIKFLLSRFNVTENLEPRRLMGARGWCQAKETEIKTKINANANNETVGVAIELHKYAIKHIYNTVLLIHKKRFWTNKCFLDIGSEQTHYGSSGMSLPSTHCIIKHLFPETMGMSDCFIVYFAR